MSGVENRGSVRTLRLKKQMNTFDRNEEGVSFDEFNDRFTRFNDDIRFQQSGIIVLENASIVLYLSENVCLTGWRDNSADCFVM